MVEMMYDRRGFGNKIMVESEILELVDAAATEELGYKMGVSLPAGTVLLISGDLGSGKTTFTQGLGKGLGIDEPILSPTFTIVNEYLEGRVPLYHFDLYRLESEEVDRLYIDLYWQGIEVTPGIVAIEWAERLHYLPPAYYRIELAMTPRGTRLAKIEAPVSGI